MLEDFLEEANPLAQPSQEGQVRLWGKETGDGSWSVSGAWDEQQWPVGVQAEVGRLDWIGDVWGCGSVSLRPPVEDGAEGTAQKAHPFDAPMFSHTGWNPRPSHGFLVSHLRQW